MHLLRIQVPDFRVLKDADITFEKEFSPRIFPLGSQNGGGKSTLLQLIFILLHCSGSPRRLPFLRNMLKGFKPCKTEPKKVLALIDIWDGEKEIKMEFFSCGDSYLSELGKDENIKLSDFPTPGSMDIAKDEIIRLKEKISYWSDISEQLNIIKAIESDDERELHYEDLKSRFSLDDGNIQEYEKKTKFKLRCLPLALEKRNKKYERLSQLAEKIQEHLISENLIYITGYSPDENEAEKNFLLCKIEKLDTNEARAFLKRLSQKVFLAAPFTQIYLFLSQKIRKQLFKKVTPVLPRKRPLLWNRDEDYYYYSELERAKSALPGFFTYDFFPVALIIESFKAARDQDTADLIKTGAYGNRFKLLLDDLNSVLTGKRVNIGSDLSEVMFEADRGGEIVELSPEDMSHGELKRLSLYMWTKYRQIEDAIVLMDEIEIAFHPDWQYQIVRDLMQWTPNSQYILATHSFDLCEALTPAHVKELEPKLLKRKNES